MKKKIIPYDLEFVKNYFTIKKYHDYLDGSYSVYKKILNYIYPKLSEYYIRNILEELVEKDFFEVKYHRGRRYFNIKTKGQKPDIGFITF